MRKLYSVYLYLRDRDLSEQSNTSRLLHESLEPASGTPGYLLSRLADEMQELLSVQSGEHVHAGRQPDTILEGSQVGYWLMLLAASHGLQYDDVLPHLSMLRGYNDTSRPYDGEEITGEEGFIPPAQECLNFLRSGERNDLVPGLRAGFALIGWACAQAGVSVLAPVEYDLEQMRRKGLVE